MRLRAVRQPRTYLLKGRHRAQCGCGHDSHDALLFEGPASFSVAKKTLPEEGLDAAV